MFTIRSKSLKLVEFFRTLSFYFCTLINGEALMLGFASYIGKNPMFSLPVKESVKLSNEIGRIREL